MNLVQEIVEYHYKIAFKHWSRHKYGIIEVSGEEVEQIEPWEAHGFYYLVIAKNDIPLKRYRLYKDGTYEEYDIKPAAKGGFGRILNFLASIGDLVRGLVGF